MQTANRFEKRILEWDGPPNEMTTRDKLYVVVDTFARWRIADPLKYFESLRDERSALSRLDDIIGSAWTWMTDSRGRAMQARAR